MTRHARRILPALLALLVALTVVMISPTTAHAASDRVRDLDARFDVRADGSVGVTYTLDWDFGETGRRGIEFGINTREPWEGGSQQDVRYEVSNIQVSSPSGAPATFTASEDELGSFGELRLRIGDAAQPLDVDRATYVISYELVGALRTFDGVPELHWDVTSRDYPPIDAFTITVTGPEGVDRARCVAGADECEQTVTDGVATLSGDSVAPRDVITVVAAFPAGSVDDAEPILEESRLVSPELETFDSRVEVGADGVMAVEQTMVYRLPADTAEERFTYRIPTRRPYDRTQDQLFDVTGIRVTADGGAALPIDIRPSGTDSRSQNIAVRVETPVSGSHATVVLRYDVVGAIDPSVPAPTGSAPRAQLRWVPGHETLNQALRSSWEWQLPGPAESLTCVRLRLDHLTPASCELPGEVGIDGGTVRVEGGSEVTLGSLHLMVVDFPASAVPSATLTLERSQDLTNLIETLGGWGLALGTAAAMATLLVRVGAVRTGRDKRFSGVPPGVVNPGGAVEESSGRVRAPVQFHPPDADLATAGMILDGRFHGRHTAAVLTHMAVTGAVELTSVPFAITPADGELAVGDVEEELFDRIERYGQVTLVNKPVIRTLNTILEEDQQGLLSDRRYFQKDQGPGLVGRVKVGVLIGLGTLAALVGLVVMINLLEAGNGLGAGVAGGISLGGVVGLVLGLRRSARLRRPLGATGTALLDQLHGFRTYLARAEAGQLDFEADQDIYRRYLPWAVLFGLTRRWTKVCQELVTAGRIPALDTSFAGGLGATELARSLGSLQSVATASGASHPSSSGSGSGSGSDWSSSGGSGGSSGFSGGGGGSGGGGTSAGSW